MKRLSPLLFTVQSVEGKDNPHQLLASGAGVCYIFGGTVLQALITKLVGREEGSG